MRSHGFAHPSVLSFAVLALAAAPLQATTFYGRPKILLHVGPPVPIIKNPLCTLQPVGTCQEAVIQAPLSTPDGPFYFVYVLASKGNLPNLAGVQFGIQYQDGNPGDLLDGRGIDIFWWQSCVNFEGVSPNPVWPGPGSGNLLVWMDLDDHPEYCQTGDAEVFGAFYLAAYSPDALRITARPVDGVAKVADCSGHESEPLYSTDLGFAAFSEDGVAVGCNPCIAPCEFDGVPVQTTTWSRMKLR
jgi:hypothetical protein